MRAVREKEREEVVMMVSLESGRCSLSRLWYQMIIITVRARGRVRVRAVRVGIGKEEEEDIREAKGKDDGETVNVSTY